MYVYHKPEDHNTAIVCRTKFRHQKIILKEEAPKADCKHILSKEMKAALLTIRVFTKEQAEAIIKET